MMGEPRIDPREAERIAGRRLDRRRAYAIVDGELCELTQWTDSCSGCFEFGDYGGLAHHYPYDDRAQCYVGAGCDECGYTGKRRWAYWAPVKVGTTA